MRSCAGVYEHLAIERRGEVTVVRIDRLPANALDPVLLSEGARCVEELAAEPPGAVVLTGREQFFSAGMDLKLAPNRAGGRRGATSAGPLRARGCLRRDARRLAAVLPLVRPGGGEFHLVVHGTAA